MLKEISKYLYQCDSTRVDMVHLNNFDSLRAHFEAYVKRGLSISGLVNKLTTFIAAVEFFHEDSTTIEQLSKYRAVKSAEKTAALKKKRSCSR